MSGKGNCISNKSTPPATHYELTNHLGNVMAVISDKASTADEPTIVSLSDYYPYGMTEPGRSYSNGVYRSGFNGFEINKEIQQECLDFKTSLMRLRISLIRLIVSLNKQRKLLKNLKM